MTLSPALLIAAWVSAWWVGRRARQRRRDQAIRQRLSAAIELAKLETMLALGPKGGAQ